MILATRNACTGADSNVSVAGSPMGGPNVIPHRCTLARVVLSFQLTISILSLGFSMTSFSGCVLPVGPRFEDPPPQENVPPFITSSDPPQGEDVPAVNRTATFSVGFTDLNADTVYVRWVTEYPPFSASSHLLQDLPPVASVNGQPTEATKSQDVNCFNAALALNTTSHKVTVFVSDQPFWNLTEKDVPTDPQQFLTHNKANSVMAQAIWTLDLTCP